MSITIDFASQTANHVATTPTGETFSLVDSAGDFAGDATWQQIQESLASDSDEGWIEGHGHGLDVYVDDNVDNLRFWLAAWRDA